MAGTTNKPITREEALQYDADSLRMDTEKRMNNIKIFENTINAENEAVKQEQYMISQIDPLHPDVKKLQDAIEKRGINIKTFEEAINNENEQINRDNEMIKIIEAN